MRIQAVTISTYSVRILLHKYSNKMKGVYHITVEKSFSQAIGIVKQNIHLQKAHSRQPIKTLVAVPN